MNSSLKRTLYIMCIFCALCACTAKKRVGGSGEVASGSGSDVRFVSPSDRSGEPVAGTTQASRPPAPRRERNSSARSPREAAKPVAVREKIVFPESETQHVSITKYNPFGTGNYMDIDLDELAAEFVYPYPGNMISKYGIRNGSMHSGTDIKAVPRDTIRAILPGVVRMSKMYADYGNIVVVRHYNGLESVYSHNVKNLVSPNDVVEAGAPLSLAGRTGRATTEHLHFELRVIGQHFNPEIIVDTQNRKLKSGVLHIALVNNKITASLAAGIPGRNRAEVQTVAQEAPDATEITLSNDSEEVIHRVAKGDTLYAIAKRYSTTVQKICELNGITANQTLHIGDKLRIRDN